MICFWKRVVSGQFGVDGNACNSPFLCCFWVFLIYVRYIRVHNISFHSFVTSGLLLIAMDILFIFRFKENRNLD